MKRPTIIEVAAFAGIAAFMWTIVSSKPAREPRASQGGRPGPIRGFMGREPPTDIAGLLARVRNDPGDHFALYSLARRYDVLGKPEQARDAYAQLVTNTRELSPDSRTYGRNIYLRAWALRALGRDDEATKGFAQAAAFYTRRAEENPDFRTNRGLLLRLGWARRLSADEAGANEAWSAGLNTLFHTDVADATAEYDKAVLLSLLGRDDESLSALTRAAALGYNDAAGARADEAFGPLRDDERFQRTIRWIFENDVAERWDSLFGPRLGGHRLFRGHVGGGQL